MTPAQRRKKIASFKEKKLKHKFSFKKLLLPFIIVLSILTYICLTGRIYARNSKITVVVNGKDQVYISTFDRTNGTISNLYLPENTQVNVSRQLGTWKAESVWKLGQNEKLDGILLSETILKNFKIPVNAWADSPFSEISEGGLISVFKSFLPYKTNLGLGDKIRLSLFSLGVSPGKRINIDLADRNFLKKAKLVGGEEGYIISENLPQSLYYIFSDPIINSANLRIEIQNYSERKSGVETASSVLEVLGGKVSAVTKMSSEDFFCEVSGRDKKIVERIAQIFECKVLSKHEATNFDLTIKLGEEFTKRY